MCSMSLGTNNTIMAVKKEVRVTSIAQRKVRFAESSSFYGIIIANWYENVEKIIKIPDIERKSWKIPKSLGL